MSPYSTTNTVPPRAARVASSSLEPADKLRAAWRRERRFMHLRGACHVVVWLVLLVIVALLLDWLLVLPGLTRIALLVACGVALGRAIHKHWSRYLRHYDPLRTALQVEDLHPELESILVSHVQLAPEQSDMAGASPRLLEAMHTRALAVTRPLDFGAIVEFRLLRRLALAAAGALVVLTGSVVWAPDFYGVFLTRMLNPSSQRAYPTSTKIVSVTGDVKLQQGAPVTLVARVEGEVPPVGYLYVRQEGPRWERVDVQPTEGDPSDSAVEFRRLFESPYRDFNYRFRIGDAASPTHRVSIIPPPRIVKSEVRLVHPAYTGLPPTEVDGLNFDALEGTSVDWTVRCDRPMSGVELIEEDGQAVPLVVDPKDRTVVRGSRKAVRPLTYRFRWHDSEHGFVWDGDVQYSMRVTQDNPPRVEILEPRHDEVGTLRKEITITFRAADDYGLRDAWIVYSVNDQPQERQPLAVPDGLRPAEPVRTVWRPADSLPSLAEGDSLIFAIEVSDNRLDGGSESLGRSRWRRLQVLSVADYLKYLSEKKSEMFSNIQGVLREETDGSESIKQLKELTQ